MGNCTSFPKGMLMGDGGGAQPPEQPNEEISAPPEGGEVQTDLEVEKKIIEAKEDDKVVEDKHSQEGEKKPDSVTKSLEENESFASAISDPYQGKDSTVAELSEVVPSTSTSMSMSTNEKPDHEEKTVADTPAAAVVVAELSKEESK